MKMGFRLFQTSLLQSQGQAVSQRDSGSQKHGPNPAAQAHSTYVEVTGE